MTSAGRGNDAAEHVPANDPATPRFPLKLKLILGAVAFLAINAGLGLFAYEKQYQIGAFAVGLYDQAVVGMTHVDNARTSFVRLVANRGRTQNPSSDPALQTDLSAVISEVDRVIERSGSPEARAQGEAVRASLIAFGQLRTADDLPFVVGEIDLGLAELARRTSDDGLHARERVVTFVFQSGIFLLASTGLSAGFVVLTSTLLGRAILARQKSVARIAHMSRYDGLTELLNRTAFNAALRAAAQRAARGENFALLCLDLDRFKQVNDTLGHPVGDALLCAVAGRLTSLVRDSDAVARLGGDEFAILQVDLESPDNAAALAQRIVITLREPYDVAGHRVVIGATVGIALGHVEARDVDTLLRNADLALYRAKQEGRGIFRFFEPEMDARAQARRQLELDLRGAIEREEFELYYQPLISVEHREIAQFEALIRWRHPQRGLVSPNDFIPLAEEIGLIVPIGAWALRTACREAAGWPDRVSVAVNLSATQFARANVVDQVTTALRESGLAPQRLEVEITETALLTDSARTLETLHALRRLGVRIAMDDFGTGYSSLSYLRSFPFDKLKIDQSFIRDLGEAGDSAAIVRAIAGMGQSLGIKTTAEGVETEQQMRQLIGDGCDELQGYFFSKPCPAAEVARLLSSDTAQQVA
jgi:diguanylate cyclase (GGDEF)-like protein